MRLVTFTLDGVRRLGALHDGEIADLTAADPGVGDDLVTLIADWDLGRAEELLASAPVHAPEAVRLLAPLRPRRNVIAVGRNYRDHAAEFSASGFDASETSVLPEHPVIFTKATTSVIGPDDAIVLANDPTGTTDYEGELGVVIGKTCRHATTETALDHVFGWTAVNDVTARALQKRHVQWFVGKSPDTFCPIGPCITTIDELPDISQTWIRTHVDGELRQEMPASALVFGVEALIVTLSAVMTLQPGDIIATGTGLGVGIGFDPPVYLQSGNVVEVSIDGVGTLRNPVI